MKPVKILAALAVSASLISPTLAADAPAAPLPAGQPAGTKQAALIAANFPLILVGIGVTLGVIAASGGFNTNTVTGTSS